MFVSLGNCGFSETWCSLLYLDRKLLLMFLVWERPRWSVWEVQHWADVRLSFRMLLYFSIMLCSTGPVFIFLSWMKVQMFPSFSNSVQRDVNSCASSQYITWNTHTLLSQHPVFNYIHIRSLSRRFCPAEEQYLRWELHLCSDSINDTF